MTEKLQILKFVKDNHVTFERYKAGFFYYSVMYPNSLDGNSYYEFPIPQEDLGQSEIKQIEPALYFMRWIRKAMDEGTLQNISK